MVKLEKRLRAAVYDGVVEREIVVTGTQPCRTLRELIAAGETGITPLSAGGWARRLAHYCFVLRKTHGLPIRTTTEEHGRAEDGSHGYHGRYTLQCKVTIHEPEAQQRQEVAA